MFTGRPPHYETPEALAKALDAYFADESNYPLTVTGLAIGLGFATKQSLRDYERREGFSALIKSARLRVEHSYEQRLQQDKPTGAIFALKNMGWTDRNQLEVTGPGGGPVQLSDADRAHRISAILATAKARQLEAEKQTAIEHGITIDAEAVGVGDLV